MTLRRGFKAEANWYAYDVRKSLGLRPESPINPFDLAKHLDVPVQSLGYYLDDHPNEVSYLRSECGQRDFSAVTLFNGRSPTIIYNDGGSIKRTSADIAHELSHCLLNHPAKPPLDENGSRHYNAELEEEANWLGPAILIPEKAALLIVQQKLSLIDASNIYGVSIELVRMRLNVTGAIIRQKKRIA